MNEDFLSCSFVISPIFFFNHPFFLLYELYLEVIISRSSFSLLILLPATLWHNF